MPTPSSYRTNSPYRGSDKTVLKKSLEKGKKSPSSLRPYGGDSIFKEREEWNDSSFIAANPKRCFRHGSWRKFIVKLIK